MPIQCFPLGNVLTVNCTEIHEHNNLLIKQTQVEQLSRSMFKLMQAEYTE